MRKACPIQSRQTHASIGRVYRANSPKGNVTFFLSWYNSKKILPQGRMISFEIALWAVRALLQSLPIHQSGVTPTQSHVTEKMKMPWASDWYQPRSSQWLFAGGEDTVHTATWIIRGGARVLLFTQDKMKNNKYCFHFLSHDLFSDARHFNSRSLPDGYLMKRQEFKHGGDFN